MVMDGDDVSATSIASFDVRVESTVLKNALKIRDVPSEESRSRRSIPDETGCANPLGITVAGMTNEILFP